MDRVYALLFFGMSVSRYLAVRGAEPGFFLSNATHILFIDSIEGGDTHPIFAQPQGRIVGVSPDVRNGLLFWSDISSDHGGIYRATLNGREPLQDVQLILTHSVVVEVNGLSVDWVSRHVYWADGRQRTLNVADYDGGNHRILAISGLLIPRGVYADPIYGYLFWSDQGTRRIERCALDGSDRRVVTTDQVVWPNELQVHDNKLYWVDAWTKGLMRSDLDGGGATRLVTLASQAGDSVIFGLTFRLSTAYVSVWNKGLVIGVDLDDLRVWEVLAGLGGGAMFGIAYADTNIQRAGDNLCGRDGNGGCSHLCLPTDRSAFRCSCPSFGGLSLSSDESTCQEPSRLLFYALGDTGEVGFVDLDGARSPDRNLVGRSVRPVAVTYDPVYQHVYWSDVHERTVHRSNLDGSGHVIFLNYNHSIGIVDGLALDPVHRQLYYTNVGQIASDGASYSWHKIEMIDLDGTGRKTVYSGLEKPRGLWLDGENLRLYHTDWGSQASVGVTGLDGSEPEQLVASLDNPNGVARMRNALYIVDSHSKTRNALNPNYPGPSQNGTLYRCSGNCSDVHPVDGIALMTPFAVAATEDSLYISDWDRQAILQISVAEDTGSVQASDLLANVASPMGLFYSLRSLTPREDPQCGSSNCEELCIAESAMSGVCSCDSYDPKVLSVDGQSCSVPSDFYLVADMNGIRLRSADAHDDETYTVIAGSSYFSNFPSLTFDPEENTIYFSDVNRRVIYSGKLDGTETSIFYETNHVIDGLALDRQRLYWTDYLSGVIASVTKQGTPNSHLELVTGLSQPRAIRIDADNNFVYWSEWGNSPRIARANLTDGSHVTTLLNQGLIRPNGLDLYEGKMYVGDEKTKRVEECNQDGTSCQELAYITDIPQGLYDLRRLEDWIIYSDWHDHSIKVISMVTGQQSTVMQNLMRPSQFYIHITGNLECPEDHSCPETCLAYPGGYQCRCHEGKKLDTDGIHCITVAGGWEAAEESACTDTCPANGVCAREAGTIRVQCQCLAGYYMSQGACLACSVDHFKPYLGPSACLPCPSGSHSPYTAATACQCSDNLIWDWLSHTCAGSKPGECASVEMVEGAACNSACTQDSDCPGAQKCCPSASRCVTSQCRDPAGLEECVYQGHPYNIGDTFTPNECTFCECNAVKSPSSEYGYATCHVQSCEQLLCGSDLWIHVPGACCPVCPEINPDQILEILNCPPPVQHMQLDPDKAYVTYDPQIEVRDNLHLSRDITLTREPNMTRFWWEGQGEHYYQNVSVTASSRSPSGSFDTASCHYTVYVIDGIPPELQCPQDVDVYSSDVLTDVVWPEPTAHDNVGLLEVPASDQDAGSAFSLGTHTVHYSVRDTSGNIARCPFHVTVSDIANSTCPAPPAVTHGVLECGQFQGCYLDCYEGYTRNALASIDSAYTCLEGAWQPAFVPHFTIMACVLVKSERWWSNGELEFLPSEGLSNDLDVEAGFRELIQSEYLHTLHLEPLVHIEVDSQSLTRRKRDPQQKFTISFTLEGPENFTSPLIGEDFDDVLSSMKQDVDSSQFRIHGNGEFLTARRYSLQTEPPEKHCGPGEQDTTLGCMVCPIGMYLADGVCDLCPVNTYNGLEGQSSCTECPYKKYAPRGSFSSYHCTDTPISGESGVPTSIIIGASVGAVSILIVVIIIVLSVRVVRGILVRKQMRDETGRIEFANMTFSEEDPYAELPADKVATEIPDNKSTVTDSTELT